MTSKLINTTKTHHIQSVRLLLSRKNDPCRICVAVNHVTYISRSPLVTWEQMAIVLMQIFPSNSM